MRFHGIGLGGFQFDMGVGNLCDPFGCMLQIPLDSLKSLLNFLLHFAPSVIRISVSGNSRTHPEFIYIFYFGRSVAISDVM